MRKSKQLLLDLTRKRLQQSFQLLLSSSLPSTETVGVNFYQCLNQRPMSTLMVSGHQLHWTMISLCQWMGKERTYRLSQRETLVHTYSTIAELTSVCITLCRLTTYSTNTRIDMRNTLGVETKNACPRFDRAVPYGVWHFTSWKQRLAV